MADSLKRLKSRKLPLNRAIISDILLWLALALLLAYGIYYFAIALPAQRGQVITLHFHNANEISKGSPVRMMGTDIGFVSDLKIHNDYVAITVQTNPGMLPIPSGSKFNILFTGLAGAKSVEVVPPATPQPTVNGQPVYLVEEPIRMRDTLNASIDVTQALQKGAENITDFFGKKKPVEELQFNIHQAHQISVTANRNTRLLNGAILSLRNDVHTNVQPSLDTIQQLTPGVAKAISITNPTTSRPEFQRFLQNLLRLSHYLENPKNVMLSPVVLEQRLNQYNQLNANLSTGMTQFHQRVNHAPITQWLNTIDAQSDRVSSTINRAATLTNRDYAPTLRNARGQIQNLNQQLEKMNAKLTPPAGSTNPPPTP
jgi:ABC-type transporter Mla subunit MlaD